MIWKDVKLATLQKMFAAEGSAIPTDESVKDYIAGMPQVANEALQRLSTAGKFIVKSIVIAHNPLDNLISTRGIIPVNDASFSVEGAHSYSFEFSGKGELHIIVDGNEEIQILESKGVYQQYRGITDGSDVTLKFICAYPSTVKNIAIYKERFDDVSDVPSYAEKVRYNLKELAADFYQLGENQIYYEGNEGSGYIQTSKYYRESDNVLVLDRESPGIYTVYYRAYPDEITITTEDDYELPLDREVAVLLPLYMASQLYKDDDAGIATQYRNEFEIALGSLVDTSNSIGYEEFVSESGWI